MAGAKFCAGCGAPLVVPAAAGAPIAVEPRSIETTPARRVNPLLLIVIGVLAGGLIGFQMRPSVMFLGQLPFQTVITRGSGLRGLDQILVSTAQQSFNVMVGSAVAGAVLAIGVSAVVNRRR